MIEQIKAKETEFNFQLKNIELIEACVNDPQKQLAKNTVFQFDINLEHRIGIEGDIVFVICSVSVLDEAKDRVLGKLKAGCIFEVTDLSRFLDKKTGKHNLPEPFVLTLNSISISTIRGIMFSFFLGTYLHNAVLPIIKPKEFSRTEK
jgi:hypothetical protein